MNRAFSINFFKLSFLPLIMLAASITLPGGQGIPTIGNSKPQSYSISKGIPSSPARAWGFLLTSQPTEKPLLHRRLMEFSPAFDTPSRTHRTTECAQKKFRHRDMAGRLLDELMFLAGSTVAPTAPGYGGKEVGAMTAPEWAYDNASTEFVHGDDQRDNNAVSRGRNFVKGASKGDLVVHSNNGGSHDNIRTKRKTGYPLAHDNNADKNNDDKTYDDARSRVTLNAFAASFHADYHNPRTHPPKNN